MALKNGLEILEGQSFKYSYTFKNESDADTDPTTVTFTIVTPGNVSTTYTYVTDAEVVKDATGQYHIIITTAQHGIYIARAAGTGGGVEDADEEFVTVKRSKI